MMTVFVESPLGFAGSAKKLDGVGPVDNRPSTDKLHHFVQKKRRKKKRKNVTCDS